MLDIKLNVKLQPVVNFKVKHKIKALAASIYFGRNCTTVLKFLYFFCNQSLNQYKSNYGRC